VKLRLKNEGNASKKRSKASAPVEIPPGNKNDSSAVLEQFRTRLFPLLIESDGNQRFCCPTFEVEDFLMCCRYLYYCRHTSLISDSLYDQYEKIFLKLNPNSPLSKPGSDKEEDYEPHVRALGLYFSFKLTRKEGDVECLQKSDCSKPPVPHTEKAISKAAPTFKPESAARKKLLIRRK
jgi:hypothetical protein